MISCNTNKLSRQLSLFKKAVKKRFERFYEGDLRERREKINRNNINKLRFFKVKSAIAPSFC